MKGLLHRKLLALLVSSWMVVLGMGFREGQWTLLQAPFMEVVVVWVLVLWYSTLPALLVTGLSEQVTPHLGQHRFWGALGIHVLGALLLRVLFQEFAGPVWLPVVAVLVFFTVDEGLRALEKRHQP